MIKKYDLNKKIGEEALKTAKDYLKWIKFPNSENAEMIEQWEQKNDFETFARFIKTKNQKKAWGEDQVFHAEDYLKWIKKDTHYRKSCAVLFCGKCDDNFWFSDWRKRQNN